MSGPTLASPNASFRVFVGTYTEQPEPSGGQIEGLFVYTLDPREGRLTPVSATRGVLNPSFLALHASQRYLYAVNELGAFNGQPGGGVSAFAVDAQTGSLTLLNHQLSQGAIPCHISLDRAGRHALVANYGGGNATVLPIDADGRLRPASAVVEHRELSAEPDVPKEPRAHFITLDPAERFALAADLGLDQVLVYWFDAAGGKLTPNDPAWAKVQAGAGPRHLDFHPNGQYVYAINELDATLTTFAYNAAAGSLRELQCVSALPEGYTGQKSCADIHVAPSGKFVYGSNRGHDSIVIFAIDPASGRLSYVGHESTQGKTPRNFAIDPTGTWLLVGNQDSDTIVTFHIDAETGRLAPTGHVTQVHAPACIRIYPMGH